MRDVAVSQGVSLRGKTTIAVPTAVNDCSRPLDVSPSGGHVALACAAQAVMVCPFTRKVTGTMSAAGTIESVLFGPGGAVLALATESSVELWNWSEASRIRTLTLDYPVTCLSFSPSGRTWHHEVPVAGPEDVGLIATGSASGPSIDVFAVEAPGIGGAVSLLPALTTGSPIMSENVAEVNRRVPTLADAEPLLQAHHAPQEEILRNLVAPINAEITRLSAARNQSLEVYRSALAAANADAERVSTTLEQFRRRVEANGLHDLTCDDVFQVMHLVNVPVSREMVVAEEIDGRALMGITEPEIEECFKLTKLGQRRRLARTIRRLADKGGFPDTSADQPGSLSWDTDRVQAWLREGQTVSDEVAAAFLKHDIDGVALLELKRIDLAELGVKTAGGKSKIMDQITVLRKQDDCAPFPIAAEVATGDDSDPTFVHEQVLEAVLHENLELRSELDDKRKRADEDAREPPNEMLCPIFQTIMEDPVMTMAGHTYERAAIESWLRNHNTDPVCRAEIPDTLIPNIAMRKMVGDWNTSGDGP